MSNIKKKIKLIGILKRSEDTDYPEELVLNEIVEEIETVKKSIPKETNLSPFYTTVDELRGKQGSLSQSLSSISDRITRYNESLLEMISHSNTSNRKMIEETLDILERLKTDLEKIRKELQKSRGGGSMPLQISVNGTVANTRYADINIVSSGATISNNDTTKKTTITLVSSGGGSQTPISGSVDGTNQTFIWSSAPNIIFVDGVPRQKVQSDGTVNWMGTTTTVLSVAPNFDIFGI